MARNTKEDALITRGLLLDAAEVLFSLKGVASVSLSQIAWHVGLSTDALYWHFENKNALLAAMFERNYATIEERIQRFRRQGKENGNLEQIRTFCMGLVDEPFTDPQRTRFFTILLTRTEMTEKNALAIQFRRSIAEVIAGLRGAIRVAIAGGDLPATLSSDRGARYLHSRILGSLKLVLEEEPDNQSPSVARMSVSAALTALTRYQLAGTLYPPLLPGR